uniref:Uncharacterized protein n=1 Tax=Arion vulgaris TaxID=1028688 RepID=A0A0B7A5K6_9EUPU
MSDTTMAPVNRVTEIQWKPVVTASIAIVILKVVVLDAPFYSATTLLCALVKKTQADFSIRFTDTSV